MLRNLWERIRGWFGLAPEERPDPEDKPARDHASLIETFQKGRRFPLQLLPDRSKVPHDIAEGWTDTRLPDPPAGMSCWVDVYDGPIGIGYVVNYQVMRGPKKFLKCLNVGPETYREQDWTEVPDPSALTP